MKQSPQPRPDVADGTAVARLPQIESVRLYRQIADLITDRIERGAFPVGTMLPTERELAHQLAVSRTSVREALIALEVTGRISIRVGHGAQILEATPKPDLNASGLGLGDFDIGPIELMEARLHVELKTSELAATNRTEVNLRRMREAIKLQSGGTSAAASQYRDGDRNFHVEIARAGGNAAYAFVVASLWDKVSRPLFLKFEELLVRPDRPKKTVREHQQIYEAIANRESAAARKAMKYHLEAVLREFSRGI